ncbi:hypothetical protein M2336_002774 [Sphingobium sp. B1D7B]|nr:MULTISPECIES: hypothetical protein [Sphingobium]MCW2361649.1 hypothetical protein [Sphingobium sp. B10D3B]MCW2390936.1 hypothetical protein [Sphingobium sp. B11D3A]MCW2401672.1 hypothetical protein [Sphingobium sp. B10D7B]MCW2406145.1 hypothetical protein [Sphingobium sp. B1D7B]MCW2408652.1 hypothetical protein [Sphingobium xanthum]
MIWFVIAVAVTAAGIAWLSRIPPPVCDECGEEIGENDDCESCVSFRTYP